MVREGLGEIYAEVVCQGGEQGLVARWAWCVWLMVPDNPEAATWILDKINGSQSQKTHHRLGSHW